MEGADVQLQHQGQQQEPDDDLANADVNDVVYDDSSDEEYNQKNFGIYQALPVEGEPDWSLGKWPGLQA